jgi:hypothetical protein
MFTSLRSLDVKWAYRKVQVAPRWRKPGAPRQVPNPGNVQAAPAKSRSHRASPLGFGRRYDYELTRYQHMPTENRQDIGLIGYKALYNIARQDVQRAGEMLKESGDDFYRRAYVRAIFAFIEADVWGRKRVALYVHQRRSASGEFLTVTEIAIVCEENADLDEDGKVKVTSLRLRFVPNLRFSFRVFAAAFDVQSYQLEVGDARWADVRKALKIRDRLMHPKGGSDFKVSDEEITTCGRALGWYDAASSRLLDLAAECLQK